ncbi:hypothetical protein B1748_16410 [Paenibacillus sp. MY03]|jgi:beta-galactosidase|uniref:beta-galactosidase GalB n=1 Tax=Paenibacillus sp. MY03 TaxID=302980 RepID=UPI000B3CE422|nr:beta-galactosidase GalB [Paenibacillus sp. MY03]OUS75682.1 hypothetical protein B1748_16410 [Paenibacillus sp. MY03]
MKAMTNEEQNGRQIIPLKEGWKFTRHSLEEPEPVQGSRVHLDESGWETVRVPHDWAIAGPFHPDHDVHVNSVMEDGIHDNITHVGRTGALPIVGIGWYRLHIIIPEAWRGRLITVEFDGVMSNSTVYMNGTECGSWPYGYTSFTFDLTEHVTFGGENVLAVQVCSLPSSSRWYPGAGIYRQVRLVVKSPVHVAPWGTYITASDISEQCASIRVRTNVAGSSDSAAKVELITQLLNPEGILCAQATSVQEVCAHAEFEQHLTVKRPALWGTAHPRLYKAVSTVLLDGVEVDQYETPFGIRTISFDAKEGFRLNGEYMKLKGVCLHHDLGPLGAAVHVRAMERQLELMKEMGCNAIRMSHNPPAPELLDLCDAMGLLVIDEAFDEWGVGKVENGYHRLFKDWAEQDLRAMISRDRNHPSIIMWSIGNEMREQRLESGAITTAFLTGIVHDADPTRPVTAGFSMSDDAIENGLAAAVDIPGWNYKPHRYEEYHLHHPDWIMYGSETASTVSSRGVYHLPAVEDIPVEPKSDLQASSYDLSAPPWGTTPDQEFMAQEDLPYMLGEFVWTGFDYLGEPTPYRKEWPSRSSYFGIMDLCGLPKDRYYLYQSQWSSKPVLHLLPHWNWEGHECREIPVVCYTSYQAAELFLNGASLGIRRKSASSQPERYRLRWNAVPYEPGCLRVVAYDENEAPAMTHEVRTAGAPASVQLEADRNVIRADGEDLSFVTVSIVDEQGILCPRANHPVSFCLEGPGEIVAVDNGDPTSTTSFSAMSISTFSGKCLVIVRSRAGEAGSIVVYANSNLLHMGKTVISLL